MQNVDVNIIKKINDLLTRAGHPNTNDNEARNCAVLAAKLYYKHKLVITNQISSNSNNDSDIWNDAINPQTVTPENSDNWQEIQQFKTVFSKGKGICKSCNKEYNTGEIVAEVKGVGVTHHKCRRFWIK